MNRFETKDPNTVDSSEPAVGGLSAPFNSALLDALKQRVVIGDGAMGTMLQAADLTLDDFLGLEGCNEILNDTRPDVLKDIHRAYFAAGADAVETNTFGCNLPNLADYDISHRIRELAEKGTALAREVADEMGPGRDGMARFVLGSMGPGTKLPSLGHAPYAVLRDAYTEAALGMIDGGADAILVETCQDLLQVKAAILGSQRAMEQLGLRLPIITHVTVETTGTMLLGSEIGAALTALEPLGIDMIGLNCATGPAEMSEHLRHLSKYSTLPVSVMPNAGLPQLGPKGAEYPLTADELAEALSGFVSEFGLGLVGGCCGTTPEHISAVADAVRQVEKAQRTPIHEPSTSSLYSAVPFEQDASILMIGERTNSNGSKAFREAMLSADYQKCLDIAKDQTRDGAHMLDLNVDYVGRDGAADMSELASRLATSSTLPIMLDSTEPAVLQAGLEHLGGRCAVNSVNYEDGAGPESRFHKIMTSGQGARRGGRRPDHRRRGPGSHRRDEGRHRQASDRGHQGKLGTRRVRHHRRRLDLPHLHRSGRGATRRHRDHRSHPSAQGCVPGTALHPGYLEHLVRFEPGRTAGSQLGVPARVHRGRSGHGDRSCVQDSADGPNS